jgi:hypothetical protein
VTFFLLDGPDRPTVNRDLVFEFAYDFEPLNTTNAKEAAVAYPESLLRTEAQRVGLEVQEPIVYGRWPEASVGRDIQDIVALRKPTS